VCLGPRWANSYYLFFLSGTSTPANVYQNGTLTTAFSPTGQVSSDAYGRFPAIYLDPSVIYRVQFFNSLGAQQWQSDPYTSQLSTVGTSALSAYGFQIAPTGEVTLDAPNTGGTGVTLTLESGDLGSVPLQVDGTLAGNSALIVNNSATTGAQAATFAATNKPGTATSSPAGWLPITCDGVQYYTPIWHGNNFTPYAANSTALGEVISGVSVTFGGNGVTTVAGGTATPGNWFTPTAIGIGAGYYINITRTGGTPGVNFSAAQGAWTNIGAGGLTITSSPSGIVNGTYRLSTSISGSPIVANGTIALGIFGVTHTYTSGSGTETVPSGASFLEIILDGAGGSGGDDLGLGTGGGGGGAGEAHSVGISVSGGQTLTYILGAPGAGSSGGNGNSGGASSVTGNGALSSTVSMSVAGAGPGLSNGVAGGGTIGAGGNFANLMGGNGTVGASGGNGGNSAAGAAGGNFATPPGAPGAGSGGAHNTTTYAGGAPQVVFKYT